MSYTPFCTVSSTLVTLLLEDYRSGKGSSLSEVRNRYEGWILYMLARGKLDDVIFLAKDIKIVSKLGKQQIINLFQETKAQIILSIELTTSLDKDFKFLYNPNLIENPQPNMLNPAAGSDLRQNIGINHLNQNTSNSIQQEKLLNLTSSNESNATDSLTPSSVELIQNKDLQTKNIQDMYALDEFYYCNKSLLELQGICIDLMSIPQNLSRNPCDCLTNSCSNRYLCCCSQFYMQKFGIQRGLIIINNKKILPRDWEPKNVLFECLDDCKCDKTKCFLTCFDGTTGSKPGLYFSKQRFWARKSFRRGEFVEEMNANFQTSHMENHIKISKNLYMDISKSNIAKASETDKGNLIPVRIFCYSGNRLVCRIGLFAETNLLKGQAVALDFSSIKEFNEVDI
jgi:hypothetical protein